MKSLFKLFTLAMLFFLMGCQSLESQSDKNDQDAATHQVRVDSIYIRFDLKETSKYRGQLSIVSPLEGQYSIIAESTEFVAAPYPEGSVLALLSIPNESFYPVSAGDSIVVTYPSYYPYITTLNTTGFTKAEINFSTYLGTNNISIFEYFFKRVQNQTELTPEECYEAMLFAIDSCQNVDVIGQSYADWLRREARYAYYAVSLSAPFADNSIPFEDYLDLDKDLDSYHYRGFLNAFARKQLGREYTIDEVLTVADNHYSDKSRDYLLYNQTRLALETEGDNQQIERTLKTVQNQFEDPDYYTLLSHRYLKVFETDDMDPDIQDPLLDPQGHIASLNEVITNLKGKLIYVDFWASWCVPCRVEFPHARELKKKRDDIAFLYISIDRQQQAWLKANEDEGIADNSFLLVDARQSQFVETYGIHQIPRYFILGKSGEILNDNAPRPSDPRLEGLFNEYLR